MGKYRLWLDSFSGAASELPSGKRTPENILAVLADHPRVSTFDMSEHRWLSGGIQELKNKGLIEELDEHYPWHRYKVIV